MNRETDPTRAAEVRAGHVVVRCRGLTGVVEHVRHLESGMVRLHVRIAGRGVVERVLHADASVQTAAPGRAA